MKVMKGAESVSRNRETEPSQFKGQRFFLLLLRLPFGGMGMFKNQG
jgi:hypothetical protein